MPYIIKEARKRFETIIDEVQSDCPENAGELNYLITCILHKYVQEHGECYQIYNDIMGVLEGSKLEIYRRAITEYEEYKRILNGDV